MPYKIDEKCNGCTLCLRRCPVNAITGDKKQCHLINPNLCIDCGVCGMVCSKEAVFDENNRPAIRMKLTEIPIATVDVNECSGCDNCASICPFGCIEVPKRAVGGDFFGVAVVDSKKCVGCKLCVSLCIKEAITMKKKERIR